MFPHLGEGRKKKNVLPSAQSDSWSGDAIALHFLGRKLTNMLISVSVGQSVRNEKPAGHFDEGNRLVL